MDIFILRVLIGINLVQQFYCFECN